MVGRRGCVMLAFVGHDADGGTKHSAHGGLLQVISKTGHGLYDARLRPGKSVFGAFGEMAAQTVALASTVCSVVRIFCSIG